MLRWFEPRLNPFPPEEPREPPSSLLGFCLYFTRGSWPWIAVTAVLMASIALLEVWLFIFLGDVVNWLSVQNRETLPQVVEDVPNAPPLKVAQGGIHFDALSFHYGKGSGVIENLSLKIKPGEKVGLVGRSGAGKSTLVNLLLRFYDLKGGRILCPSLVYHRPDGSPGGDGSGAQRQNTGYCR